MSNYRNHREPRRRDFDDDGSQEPSYFQRDAARAPPPSGSTPTDAQVLWFNAEKGFGFVKLANGSDAFLHIKTLESAGHQTVAEGVRLTVRIGEGQKGTQVTDVLEVGSPTIVETAGSSSSPTRGSTSIGDEQIGTVKRYLVEKGFGFIALDGGSKDAFVHVSALKRSGLELLEEGQRVMVEVAQGGKGLEVRSVRLT